MDKDFGMKSIIRLGINNRKQMMIDCDYDAFDRTAEDRELMYLMIGAMEKVKADLIELMYQQDEDEQDGEEEEDENYSW